MSENNTKTNEFVLREHQMLHAKIDLFTQEQFVSARWALAFTSIFWTYLAVARPGWLPSLAYWTPAIVVVLLGIRVASLLLTVRKMQAYLMTSQEYLGIPAVLGWEKMRTRRKAVLIKTLCLVYWLSLLLINVGLAGVYVPILMGTWH